MQILLIKFADFMPFKPPALAALMYLSEFDMLIIIIIIIKIIIKNLITKAFNATAEKQRNQRNDKTYNK